MLKANLRIRISSCIFILILMISSVYFSDANAQVDYYHEEFDWSYKGYEWTWSLEIPKSLYEAYRSVSVSTRLSNQASGYSLLTTTNDDYLQMVAEKLEDASSKKGYDSYDKVSFVLAFIQSLPYTSDSVTSGHDEYPRFPLETLVDKGGDCEDTSILFATLTLIMGYGTVYISPPEHFAVGILGEEGLPGYYFLYKDRHYYYCETTGDGWSIGDLPPEYQDVEATIYEINTYQQYLPSVWDIPITTPSPSITPTLAPTSEPDSSFLSENYLIIGVGIFSVICLVGVSIVIGRAVVTKEEEPNITEPKQFCKYCGAENKKDNVFCENCGKKRKQF